MKQANLLENILDFSNKSRPRSKNDKEKKKQNTLDSINALFEGRESILNAFRTKIFSIKEKQGKRLKILVPKQMLQRLPIALVQVKAGTTSENLMKSGKSYILCINQKQLLKTYATI